jgi:hypothetical protein
VARDNVVIRSIAAEMSREVFSGLISIGIQIADADVGALKTQL